MKEIKTRIKEALEPFDLDGASGFRTQELDRIADAILDAIREPTDAMCYAGLGDGMVDSGLHSGSTEAIWRRMVDEARK